MRHTHNDTYSLLKKDSTLKRDLKRRYREIKKNRRPLPNQQQFDFTSETRSKSPQSNQQHIIASVE